MNRVILIFIICSFLTACATSLSNVNKGVMNPFNDSATDNQLLANTMCSLQ